MVKKLLVGLGNPGEQYMRTRHNLGARVVEAWAETHPEAEVLLPKAGVYMNDFGTILPQGREIVLLHDDIELPLGQIKFASGGSAKGHNGVKSVQAALGTNDIPRLRLGIGRPPEGLEVDEFVLGRFTEDEERVVAEMTAQAQEHLTRLWEGETTFRNPDLE